MVEYGNVSIELDQYGSRGRHQSHTFTGQTVDITFHKPRDHHNEDGRIERETEPCEVIWREGAAHGKALKNAEVHIHDRDGQYLLGGDVIVEQETEAERREDIGFGVL
ncbi:hypothetical protein C7446_0239 [Kushneria sinocarnis]|uniref:Uncharacterized protein n=1 Tax=Kushneria sinocarnis TaxID=595502 RepID=A0A420X105_9GAMM|nr:hypothetical protein [Kushneria sinocarnis]RKR07427.1 hypothetical protein C7446_0239 [Kushneria sinocarnis]